MDTEQVTLLRGGSLTPAYRTCKTGKEAKDLFLSGKDFTLHNHRGSIYCSIRDFMPGCTVVIRYGQNYSKVTSVKVPKHV